jgi:hypothetical protein
VRNTYDRVGRLDDLGARDLLDTQISGCVENGSLQFFSSTQIKANKISFKTIKSLLHCTQPVHCQPRQNNNARYSHLAPPEPAGKQRVIIRSD